MACFEQTSIHIEVFLSCQERHLGISLSLSPSFTDVFACSFFSIFLRGGQYQILFQYDPIASQYEVRTNVCTFSKQMSLIGQLSYTLFSIRKEVFLGLGRSTSRLTNICFHASFKTPKQPQATIQLVFVVKPVASGEAI